MAQPVYPQLRKYPYVPALTLRAISGLVHRKGGFDHHIGADIRALIRASPLSGVLQSAASSLIAHPEQSMLIL
jgi:hypothetical protein